MPYTIAITNIHAIVGCILTSAVIQNYFAGFDTTNDSFVCFTSPKATTEVYILGQ